MKVSPQEKRLERACTYVSDLWFPPNPHLLKKIQNNLKDNRYNDDLTHPISGPKGDFSLFLFSLKKLLEMLKAEGVNPPENTNPLELLELGGIEKLKRILSSDENSYSRHFFSGMSESQALRFQEVVISTSTAQVLANQNNIRPDMGFCAALLRQLGLSLIAWNYPSVYDKAIIEVRKGKDLEVVLTQALGFSPSLLAISLARKWGIKGELLSVFDVEEYFEDQESKAASSTLATICQVGEALARANNPENYPKARSDWEKAKSYISKQLGNDGLKQIQEAINENATNYVVAVPHCFKAGLVLDPENHISASERKHRRAPNSHLESCWSHVKRNLYGLYDDLAESKPVSDIIRNLANEIIPSAGFSGGNVYVVDPTNSLLVPHLHIGNPRLRNGTPLDYKIEGRAKDSVLLAFQSEMPIVSTNLRCGEALLATISGLIGYHQRVGVLYLEIPQIAYNDAEKHHLIHFKAFAAALNDCLGLTNGNAPQFELISLAPASAVETEA